MRTTIALDDDVAAAVELLRRERNQGLSETLNALVRLGLTSKRTTLLPFKQTTSRLGLRIDVTNIAEAIEELEGPGYR